MLKYILLTISIFIGLSVEASTLKPFETDYCTFFVEGTPGNPNAWKSCCYDHDLRYWFGGTKKEQKLADKNLKSCVEKKSNTVMANMMYYAVRAGHVSPFKHKTHWGWGWENKREFFQALSQNEKSIIIEELNHLDLSDDYLAEFIKLYQLD